MSETYGRSFFGEVTSRLANLLGIKGRVPIELGASITPVVLVGDATLPGMNDRAGQRWAFAINSGANQGILVSCNPLAPGLIVEGWHLGNGAVAGTLQVNHMTAAAVAAAGPVTPGGVVIDDPNGGRPPILSLQGNALGGTTFANYPAVAINTRLEPVPMDFFIAPGAGITFHTTGVGSTVTGTVWGRLF